MYEAGTVTWNEIGDNILQKITFTRKGLLLYEYHYKTKSSKPCLVFVIKTAASKEFGMFNLMEKDLRDALSFADAYQKILGDKKPTENKILLKALFKAIVINYGRCFKKANARNKLLAEDVISNKNKEAHSELIRIRDKYVAHADYTEYESCRCLLILTHEIKYRKRGGAILQPLSELEQGILDQFTENYKPPIIEAHNWVKNKLESLLPIVHQPFEGEDILGQLYKYAKNKKGRIIINEKKLKEMTGS